MLSNIDLSNLAMKLKINLVAICSKDELDRIKPKTGGYIINMENSNVGNGSHWTAFILYNENGKQKAIYSDSYGVIYPTQVEKFIKRFTDSKIGYNTRMIQKIQTTECGYYALSFLFNLQYKRIYDDLVFDFQHYMSLFSNDLNEELKILKKTFLPFKVNFYAKTVSL